MWDSHNNEPWYKFLVRSMTGYGRGQSDTADCLITAEIRSVNHRFLDLKVRGAPLDASTEEKLRRLVGAAITRGSVSVFLRVDRRGNESTLRIDTAAARRVYEEFESLRMSLGLVAEVPLSMICSHPGVLVASSRDEGELAKIGAGALVATAEALQELSVMREDEGRALKLDMEARMQSLTAITNSLAELARCAPLDLQQRFADRIKPLLKNSLVPVDETRLAQEVAMAVDRLDSTEEIVRIRSHLEQWREFVTATKPLGRRLEFLIQELGREFNTIVSKSQSASISRLVIEAKAELEKVREQVQNVE